MQHEQKDAPSKPEQGPLAEKEGEMIQALQSTLRIIQAERSRQTAQLSQQAQAQQQRKERESASPVEMKSPKARRRRSSAK
jgi:hypothetical protein